MMTESLAGLESEGEIHRMEGRDDEMVESVLEEVTMGGEILIKDSRRGVGRQDRYIPCGQAKISAPRLLQR